MGVGCGMNAHFYKNAFNSSCMQRQRQQTSHKATHLLHLLRFSVNWLSQTHTHSHTHIYIEKLAHILS